MLFASFFFSLSAVCNKERNITAKVAEHSSTKYHPLYQVRPLMPKDGSDLEDSKIIMPEYIYRLELDSSVSKIARKEMQDTVDGTGLNLLKQTRKQKFNVMKTAAGVEL